MSVPAHPMKGGEMAPDIGATPPLGVMGGSMGMAGKLMVSYRFMHTEWNGNRAGRSKISAQQAQAGFGFNAIPTDMNVNMHSLGLMYTPSPKVTLGLMAPYITKWMGMQMLAPGGTPMRAFSMTTQGLGDVRATGLLSLYRDPVHRLHFNLGVSAPTGSIDRHATTPASPSAKMPYIMQIGSGTWDILPGLTYAGRAEKVGWGAQYAATFRLGENSNDYARGNRHHWNLWANYAWRRWAQTSIHLMGSHWGQVRGSDPDLNPMMVQTANPRNYGGTRIEGALGFDVKFPSGWLKNQIFGFEFTAPLYQDLNGLQMDLDLRVSGSWRRAF
jgi:hypothetical protein